jgi:hypothetical protein
MTILLGAYTLLYVATFFMVAFVLGMALSLAAVSLEELSFRRYPRMKDLMQLFFLAILENFGYRQINQYWRVRGVFSALFRKKSWGKMEHKGFGGEKTS